MVSDALVSNVAFRSLLSLKMQKNSWILMERGAARRRRAARCIMLPND